MVKVVCLGCNEEFAGPKSIKKHRHGHKFKCVHMNGAGPSFVNTTAVLHHLRDSQYHKDPPGSLGSQNRTAIYGSIPASEKSAMPASTIAARITPVLISALPPTSSSSTPLSVRQRCTEGPSTTPASSIPTDKKRASASLYNIAPELSRTSRGAKTTRVPTNKSQPSTAAATAAPRLTTRYKAGPSSAGPAHIGNSRGLQHLYANNGVLKAQTHIVQSSSAVPRTAVPAEAVSSSSTTSRWTSIPDHQRVTALEALTAMVHPLSVLSTYDYEEHNVAAAELFLPSPRRRPGVQKRSAVAIDCEMVQTSQRYDELVRLTAIDYLTGETIIDTLVNPPDRVWGWRTKITGVSAKIMTVAVREGRALHGWHAARAQLWKYIDSETILIGQALNHDLKSLRMIHLQVVDSGIITSLAVGMGKRQWGLRKLCKDLVHVQFREGSNTIHDSAEDAFAAREVVIYCIREPAGLEEWASRESAEIEAVRIKAQERKAKKAKEKMEKEKKDQNEKLPQELAQLTLAQHNQDFFDAVKFYTDTSGNEDDDSDGRRLTFEELADQMEWPEGYDGGMWYDAD